MTAALQWPDGDVSQVPFGVYADPDVYRREQERIFRGPVWHLLCLEAEIPHPGDYRTTDIGETPVIVVRSAEGAINAMVNRCEIGRASCRERV